MGKKKDKKKPLHISEVRLQLQRFRDVKIVTDKTGLQFMGTPDEPEIIEVFPIENEAEFSVDMMDAVGAFASYIDKIDETVHLLDEVHHAFSWTDGVLTIYTVMLLIDDKLRPAYSKKSRIAIDKALQREQLKADYEADAINVAMDLAEATETQALHDAGFVTGDAAYNPPLGPTSSS